MKKIKIYTAILLLTFIFSCSYNNDDNENSSIPSPLDLPKVSDIYNINAWQLETNYGIPFDINQLQNSEYAQNLIESITQLSDASFNEVCHITYDANGYVNYYKIGINPVSTANFDYGGTLQRDNQGNILSINNSPIIIENGSILFKESNGWYSSNGPNQQVDYNGRKLTKTFYRDSQEQELTSNAYTYQYNGSEFIKKKRANENYTFYEVSEYYDENFNLPWVINHSDKRLALELAFGFRLMQKLPKKTINSIHLDQDVDVTHIIKDASNRIVLLVGRNIEYETDHIVVYQYAE